MSGSCFLLSHFILHVLDWTVGDKQRCAWSTMSCKREERNGGVKLNTLCLSLLGTWHTCLSNAGQQKETKQHIGNWLAALIVLSLRKQTALRSKKVQVGLCMWIISQRQGDASAQRLPSKLLFCPHVSLCPQTTTQQFLMHKELRDSCL